MWEDTYYWLIQSTAKTQWQALNCKDEIFLLILRKKIILFIVILAYILILSYSHLIKLSIVKLSNCQIVK